MKPYSRHFSEDVSSKWKQIKEQVFSLIDNNHYNKCDFLIESSHTSLLDGEIVNLTFWIQDRNTYAEVNMKRNGASTLSFVIDDRDTCTLYTDFDHGIKIIGRDYTYKLNFIK